MCCNMCSAFAGTCTPQKWPQYTITWHVEVDSLVPAAAADFWLWLYSWTKNHSTIEYITYQLYSVLRNLLVLLLFFAAVERDMWLPPHLQIPRINWFRCSFHRLGTSVGHGLRTSPVVMLTRSMHIPMLHLMGILHQWVQNSKWWCVCVWSHGRVGGGEG